MKRKSIAIITAVLTTLIIALLPGGAMQTAHAAGEQNWMPVGTAGFSADIARYNSLVFDNGTPYVAYSDNREIDGVRNKATVMKYNGSSWETVGTAGFSAGEARHVSLAFYNGTPYVAYTDYGNGEKATVMKFGGSSWETVGTAGFSDGEAYFTSLALDDGTPYVAYSDYREIDGVRSRATVMKFGGSSWETVGTAGFSAGEAIYLSLAVDNGTPYVLYTDRGNGDKATVMKYNDQNTADPSDDIWETVGTAGFSDGGVYAASLVFDDGTSYVAYADYGNGEKATVMKFGGSSWETVGAAGFSADSVSQVSLAVDGNNTPYIAYRDKANGDKATVMKFGGSSWETVGAAGFSAGVIESTSLAIDNGTPYMVYADGGNGYKATMMQLNNAPTDLHLDDNSLSENEISGTVVGLLSVHDSNTLDSHTYSLVSGIGDNDNGSFTIDGDELKTAEVFDYETKHTYNIRVRVTDIGGLYDEQTWTINVTDVRGDANDNEIIIDFGSVTPKGAVGSAYSYAPTVLKGTAPYSWKATGLPTGLSIDSATGEISGTPTATGTSAATVTVTDSLNASLTIDFDITIGYANLDIDTVNLLAATIGEDYSCTVGASGGNGTYSWYASGLPSGLSIARDTGTISGTPNETGAFFVKVRVYDGENKRAEKTYSLIVNAQSQAGKYIITPDMDSAYTVSTEGGFTTLTINRGVSGFRYIKARIDPVTTHEGEETVVFVQMRDNVQIGFCTSTQDFDIMHNASVGFNVKYGDLIKIYIVDCISNDPNTNPTLLQ